MNTEDKIMLIAEAAKVLGVSVSTLRNWHRSGRLVPEVHVLTKTRIYKKSVLENMIKDATLKNVK